MRYLFKNKVFRLGFLVGVAILILLNLYQIFGTSHPPCHHCVDWLGFPLPFYQEYITSCKVGDGSFGCYVGEFTLVGTILNIFITVLFSFFVGLFFKFVWSKFFSQKLQ
jgi:hypothetical protein